MDDLLEFLLELFLEGCFEFSTDKKLSKWIRYPLIAITSLLFLAVFFLIIWLSIIIYKESIFLAIVLIIIDIVLLIGGIKKFKKTHLEKHN